MRELAPVIRWRKTLLLTILLVAVGTLVGIGLPVFHAVTQAPRSATPSLPVVSSAVSRDGQETDLRQAITDVEARLKETEREYASYAGGLVKTLVGATAAIQKQTLEMLKQKEASWTFGIGLRYTVDGETFSLPADASELLSALDTEIAQTKRKIAQNDEKASHYSGGLVKAMLVSAAATARQTLAMLEQRRVALQFGLPQYIQFQDAYLPQGANSPVNAPVVTPEPEQDDWSIVSLDTRVTEKTSAYWKWAWKLRVKSTGTKDQVLAGEIDFQDRDGFIVSTDRTGKMVLPAGEERTFTGYDLIGIPSASSVAKASAKVRLVR